MDYKKILYVSPHYKRKGGIASVVSQYKEYLGNDFRHFSTIDYSNKILNALLFPLKIVFFVIYLLLHRDIKIIHIHGSSQGSFYRKYLIFIISKKFFNMKVVYHIHSGRFDKFYNQSNRWVKKRIIYMINTSEYLICLSEYWKCYFMNKFKKGDIFIVNNIVVDNGGVVKKRKNDNCVIFLFLGKIDDNKGIFDVIKSVKNNIEFFRNKIKIIVGGNGEVEQFKEIIKDEKLKDIFIYVGWVSGEKKLKLFRDADVMLLPSYSEGLPISLLEALSFGLPLVSTHVGGIPEILQHNKNGIVVEPGNQRQITNALIYYVKNNKLVSKHGEESYKLANNYFPAAVFNQLRIIYTSIL